MKQIFETYDKWEDYHCGMYNLNDVLDKDKKVINAIYLLSSTEQFYNVCLEILDKWKVSCDVNLSNKNQNRRSWLGAAACTYLHNCPEYLTRIAWSLLNKDVQDKANNIAEKIIKEYERKNTKVHTGVGNQMLLQWNT